MDNSETIANSKLRRLCACALVICACILAPSMASAFTIKAPINFMDYRSGLVVYWPFNGNDVTDKIYDRGKNEYNGYMYIQSTSTAEVAGKYGQGIFFNATGFASTTLYNLGSSSGTVSWWMKPTSRFNAGTQRPMWGQMRSAGSDFSCQVFDDNRWYCGWSKPGQDYRVTFLASADNYPDGIWSHYFLTWNSNGTYLYRNNVLIGQNLNPPPFENWGAPFVIGSLGHNWGDYYRGAIDEFRIFNRELSATERVQIYNAGVSSVASSPKTVLMSGLVGYWSFDGNTIVNGAVRDLSGSGNTGYPVNVATSTFYTAGKIGQGLKFDGVGSRVLILNSSSMTWSASQKFSVTAWIKVSSHNSQFREILRKGNSSDSWFFLLNTSNKIALTSSGNSSEYTNGWAYPADGNWHLVAGVYDGTNCYIFSDGLEKTSYSCASPSTNTENSSIGARPTSGDQVFLGSIDDVRLYNRALTATEIAALYNASAGKFINPPAQITNGLVAHWTMNGGDVNWSTGRVADSSGLGNHGYVINISTSTSPTQGKLGQALKFIGSGYVMANHASTIDPGSSSFSVSLWTNVGNLPSDSTLIAKRSTSNGIGYEIGIDNANRILARFEDVGGEQLIRATSILQADVWHHIVITFDASGSYKSYSDGVEQTGYFDSTDVSALGSLTTTNPVSVGTYYWTSAFQARPFPGLIDDVRIYNRVLALDEVKALYNMGR